MSQLPEAAPIPDKPPLHIKGGNLVVASPVSMIEACFAVPAVRALRHARPSAKLVIATPASIRPLWQGVAGIDEFIEYPDGASLKDITGRVQACGLHLDSSFAWEGSEAALAMAKAKVPQRLGYDLKGLAKKLTDKLPAPVLNGPVPHRVRYYMGLLEALGIECYHARNFTTPPLPPRPNPARIGLVPGSMLGGAYRWNVDRFRDLGIALKDRFHADLVILALPGHLNEANELADRLNRDSDTDRARNFATQFDLPQLLNALPHCTALVANDSAVTHLAAHLGVPTVALFGPGNPAATRPLGKIHTILSQHVECSPCNQPTCPLDHHRCMTEITVERVLEAVQPHLQPPADPPPAAPAG